MTLILADTNVALRMVEKGHDDHAVAMSAVRTAAERGYLPVLVPQIIYEFWAVATRPTELNGLGMNTSDALSEVNDLLGVFRLLRDERAIFEIWLELVVQFTIVGKQSHDTRLVAAMRRHQISHILTLNIQDFTRFSDLVVVSPRNIDQLPIAD